MPNTTRVAKEARTPVLTGCSDALLREPQRNKRWCSVQVVDATDLATVPLFGGLPESGLERLAKAASLREVRTGEVLYQEGDPGRELFVVVSGDFVAFKVRDGIECTITNITTGDFFGDMSFVDMQARSATVRALTPGVVLAWSYNALRDTYVADMKSYTLLVMNIAREVSRRLRRADDQRCRAIAAEAEARRPTLRAVSAGATA